jgi:pentatricopeptide repeat protein
MFDRMEIRSVISWNAMISGYAQHGKSKMALKLYQRMCMDGISPTKVTFFSVLSACSFSGLLHDAQSYFDSMERNHELTPEVVHYNCMIDLLGKAGMLEEAETLIKQMPCEPIPASWMTLLSACRVKRDIRRAQLAAVKVAQLDPQNSAPFVMLSNIYASCGMWEEVMNVRRCMKERGLDSGEVNHGIHLNSIHEI